MLYGFSVGLLYVQKFNGAIYAIKQHLKLVPHYHSFHGKPLYIFSIAAHNAL